MIRIHRKQLPNHQMHLINIRKVLPQQLCLPWIEVKCLKILLFAYVQIMLLTWVPAVTIDILLVRSFAGNQASNISVYAGKTLPSAAPTIIRNIIKTTAAYSPRTQNGVNNVNREFVPTAHHILCIYTSCNNTTWYLEQNHTNVGSWQNISLKFSAPVKF